ncbi:MAG TPA: hypothetical protein VG758_02860 [Hyphomicrobiaceae bacterium]|jgi:hypothetical protein|nr:hypothetical protein [Hyphomicrobiaceae bacterium]
MSRNFHETYAPDAVKPPSERSTGLVLAGAAVIAAVVWRHSAIVPWAALGVAVVLSALGMMAPRLLKPVNLIWFRLGMLLHRIVNPIIMLLMFAVFFVPAGYIMRLWHDPLRSVRASDSPTYWIARESGAERAGSMTDQF